MIVLKDEAKKVVLELKDLDIKNESKKRLATARLNELVHYNQLEATNEELDQIIEEVVSEEL